METGSITEALIAGLAGVLEFLSFGLFDAETLKGVIGSVGGFVTKYIVDPIANLFGSIGDAILGVFGLGGSKDSKPKTESKESRAAKVSGEDAVGGTPKMETKTGPNGSITLEKAPMTNPAPRITTTSESSSGTIPKGVTRRDMMKHPNFKKHLAKAEANFPGSNNNIEDALDEVENDMIDEQNKVRPKAITPAAPNTANKVSQASSDLEMAKQKQNAPSNTVVSAPTNVTKQTKNVMVKQPVRNSESSINSYFKSRYA
jgi:hypothetical protein